MFKAGIPTAVAVAVSGETQIDKVFEFEPKISKHFQESNSHYDLIIKQKSAYETAVQRFKEVLGEEDFNELKRMPFWNSPNSEEFRSQFINNRRPIVRTLAQERFKLWDLVAKYSQNIVALNELFAIILGLNQSPSRFSTTAQSVQSFGTSQEFLMRIHNPTSFRCNNGADYFRGCELTIDVSVNHIIDDDEGIQSAKRDKATFDKKKAFFALLKSLKKDENDDRNYCQPSLFVGEKISLYEYKSIARNTQFFVSDGNVFQHGNYSSPQFSNDIPFALIIPLFHALQLRGMSVLFNHDNSYTITF